MGFSPKRKAKSISGVIAVSRCIWIGATGKIPYTSDEVERARGFDDALSWLIGSHDLPEYIDRFMVFQEEEHGETIEVEGRRPAKGS